MSMLFNAVARVVRGHCKTTQLDFALGLQRLLGLLMTHDVFSRYNSQSKVP